MATRKMVEKIAHVTHSKKSGKTKDAPCAGTKTLEKKKKKKTHGREAMLPNEGTGPAMRAVSRIITKKSNPWASGGDR